MLIKGTGKVEKFDVLGVNVYDISMDSGEDLADLLADHEGQRVKVFIFEQGESEDLIKYVQDKGEEAKRISRQIDDIEKRINEMAKQSKKENAGMEQATAIMSAGIELMVKGIVLQRIFDDLKEMTESEF